MLKIELVYIPAHSPAVHLHFQMQEGATVGDVLRQADWYSLYPETKNLSIGIFSKSVNENECLKQGDRIEIYRPLALDPMEKRRLNAKKNK